MCRGRACSSSAAAAWPWTWPSRRGAWAPSSVTVACLETCDEMPALLEEVERGARRGHRAGALVRARAAPARRRERRRHGAGALHVGVRRAVLLRADASTRASGTTVEADEVILAVGQRVDLTALAAAGLRSRAAAWRSTRRRRRTGLDGVFAGGDVATGPATVIAAIGAGRRAAEAHRRRPWRGAAVSRRGRPARRAGSDRPRRASRRSTPPCAAPSPRCDACRAAPGERTICGRGLLHRGRRGGVLRGRSAASTAAASP